jgi:signal peptidase I
LKENKRRLGVAKVRGWSMFGKIHPGSKVAYELKQEGEEYEIGDIIAYYLDGVYVIHEVVGAYCDRTRELHYITKGVNNPKVDAKHVSDHQVIGKVVDFSKQELTVLIEMAERGRIPSIEGLGMTKLNELKIELNQILDVIYRRDPRITPKFIQHQKSKVSDIFQKLENDPQNINLYLELIYNAEKNYDNSITLDIFEKVKDYLLRNGIIRDLETHPNDHGYTFKTFYKYFKIQVDQYGMEIAIEELNDLGEKYNFIELHIENAIPIFENLINLFINEIKKIRDNPHRKISLNKLDNINIILKQYDSDYYSVGKKDI